MGIKSHYSQGRKLAGASQRLPAKPSQAEAGSASWFYSELIETLSVGVVVLDLLNEQIVIRNAASQRLFSQYSGSETYKFYESLFLAEYLSGTNVPEETARASRCLRYGQLNLGYTIHSIDGGYICIFVQDISGKTREREILQAKLDNSAWEYLLFSFRQEFGKPLASLKNTLRELRLSAEPSSKEFVRKKIDQGLSQLSKMEALLHRMQILGHPGRLDADLVDMNFLVLSILESIEPHLSRRNILLKKILPDDNIFGNVDPLAFRQVLSHIFDNAIDALTDVPNAQIVVNQFQTERLIHLKIEDNGCGIPEVFMDKLFHPFYSMKRGNLGFGLTLSRKLLAEMKGTIHLKSIEQVGTIVEITLPTCV